MLLNSTAVAGVDERERLITGWHTSHSAQLARYLLRLLGDEQQAAELLQETFLRALEALRRQPPPDNASAWLYAIASNLAYNALRRQRLRRWLRLSGGEESASFEGAVGTAQTIRWCLRQLSAKEAQALLLYEHAGLSHAEIAALNGEQVEAVRKRIYRARSKFCALYRKEHPDEM